MSSTSQSAARLKRLLASTAQQELVQIARDMGITEHAVTDAEMTATFQLFTDGNFSTRALELQLKRWLIRQIRSSHSPIDTARYLHYTFYETLVYLVAMICWLPTIQLVQMYASAPWQIIAARLVMTIHLGYYNLLWSRQIFIVIWFRVKSTGSFMMQLMRVVPRFLWEISAVLFEVFIGWPLATSIAGIILSVYLLPIVYPYMRLSSVFKELYLEWYLGLDNVEYHRLPTPLWIFTWLC